MDLITNAKNLDREIARQILYGQSIEDKLAPLPLQFVSLSSRAEDFPTFPGRLTKYSFSKDKVKFPKRGSLHDPVQKAKALHFFANHELLAIEIMAAIYLKFPAASEEDLKFLRGLATTLRDEQKHFQLYVERINQLGHDFGDFPVNSFFWDFLQNIQTREQYLAVMALTFESANLDFAQFYANLFYDLKDIQTAKILNIVLEDEMSHVAFGVNYFKRNAMSEGLWEKYLELLPWPLTPARAKGIQFYPELRTQASLPEEFIQKIKSFDDHYPATSRREWKEKQIIYQK